VNAPKKIVLTWDEWQTSRAAKRANLMRLGLDVPSRRKTAIGSQEQRLRKVFDGRRVPAL